MAHLRDFTAMPPSRSSAENVTSCSHLELNT